MNEYKSILMRLYDALDVTIMEEEGVRVIRATFHCLSFEQLKEIAALGDDVFLLGYRDRLVVYIEKEVSECSG